ncbi:MAG: DUF4388 domain-containing protein [Oscillochloris sp.]|nr:DUF4388 domain-containing protein [Oscillochloris sp.]
MKLEGTLDTFPLRELIDMITYSSVTGALNIYAEQGCGHLYFRDGSLYHCEYMSSNGTDALAELLEVRQANFSFVGDSTSDQETLWGDIAYHVQVAERLANRWRNIRCTIPSLNLVPVLLVPFESALRRVGPAHHQVLDRIDGQHSLKMIANDLSWAEIDVADAVAQMFRDSLVELRDQEQAVDVQSPDPPRTGLFDRLRTRPGETTRQASDHSQTSPEDVILRVLRN